VSKCWHGGRLAVLCLMIVSAGPGLYAQPLPQSPSAPPKIPDVQPPARLATDTIGASLDEFVGRILRMSANDGGVVPFQSLKTLLQPAFSSLPVVRRNLETRVGLEAGENNAKSKYLPKLSGSISSGDQNTDYSTDGSTRSRSLTASQLVYDFGSTLFIIDAARSNTASGVASLERDNSQALLDLIQAILEMQRSGARVDLMSNYVESRRQFRDLVKEKTSLGASSQADLLRAESKLLEANDELPGAIRAVNRARSRVIELFNTVPSAAEFFQLPALGNLERELTEEQLERSKEVLSLKAALESSDQELRALSRSRWGGFSLEATHGQTRTASLGEREDQTVSIVYRATLFDSGELSSRIAQAGVKRNQAEWELLQLKRTMRKRIQDSIDDHLSQRASVASRVSVVNGAKVSAEIARELFSYNRGSLPDVFRAQEEYLTAAKNLLDALTEMHQSYYIMMHEQDALLTLFDARTS
jgi:outer membrane protein, adhesin transport system